MSGLSSFAIIDLRVRFGSESTDIITFHILWHRTVAARKGIGGRD